MGNPISNIRGLYGDGTPKPVKPAFDIAHYWKAVLAFVTPGAIVLGNGVLPGSDGGSAITAAEWITAAVACVVTGAGVWAVPNKAKPPYPTHRGDKA